MQDDILARALERPRRPHPHEPHSDGLDLGEVAAEPQVTEQLPVRIGRGFATRPS